MNITRGSSDLFGICGDCNDDSHDDSSDDSYDYRCKREILEDETIKINTITYDVELNFNSEYAKEYSIFFTHFIIDCDGVLIKHLDESNVKFQIIGPYYNIIGCFGGYYYYSDWKEKLIQMLLSKQLQQ